MPPEDKMTLGEFLQWMDEWLLYAAALEAGMAGTLDEIREQPEVEVA